MWIPVRPSARKVVCAVVLLVGAHADVRDVAKAVEPVAESAPGAANRAAPFVALEPAALHAHRNRVGEHRGAGRLRPRLRVVHELPPQPVGTLAFEKPSHHLAVAGEDAVVELVALLHLREDERHPCGHPARPAPPSERHVRCVVEEPVRALQLVEVQAHFARGPADVLRVAGKLVSLRLQEVDHVHVVDPQPRLTAVAVLPPSSTFLERRVFHDNFRLLRWLAPLEVGELKANLARLFVA